jgi:hypothetical protein
VAKQPWLNSRAFGSGKFKKKENKHKKKTKKEKKNYYSFLLKFEPTL